MSYAVNQIPTKKCDRNACSFLPLPTSALTHPKMFTRLGVFRAEQLEEYHFQHMVGLDALVVYNTREELYLWWRGKNIQQFYRRHKWKPLKLSHYKCTDMSKKLKDRWRNPVL